jgi:hypothetical protein
MLNHHTALQFLIQKFNLLVKHKGFIYYEIGSLIFGPLGSTPSSLQRLHNNTQNVTPVPPAVTPVPTTRTRTNNQKSTATTPSTALATPPTPPTLSYELLVHVLQPDKKVRTAGRQAKTTKVEPLKFGPINVPVDITWDRFLELVGGLVHSPPTNLSIASFEWRFLTPQNSMRLPLSNEQGLKSLAVQTNKKIEKNGSAYIILLMQPPAVPQTPVVVS